MRSILIFVALVQVTVARVSVIILYKKFVSNRQSVMGTLSTLLPGANAQIDILDMKHTSNVCTTLPDLLMILIIAAVGIFTL